MQQMKSEKSEILHQNPLTKAVRDLTEALRVRTEERDNWRAIAGNLQCEIDNLNTLLAKAVDRDFRRMMQESDKKLEKLHQLRNAYGVNAAGESQSHRGGAE
jgi:hypothetical protein